MTTARAAGQTHPPLNQFFLPYTCLFCDQPMPAAYMACGKCRRTLAGCRCCGEPILDAACPRYCWGCEVLECTKHAGCRKFSVGLADPSWDYGWAWGNGAAAHTYKTSSLEEMMQMNPAALFHDQAVFVMWTTGAFWEHAGILMRAWGFTPKTLGFTWLKVYNDNSIVMNPGQYTRQNIEPTRVGTRGGMVFPSADGQEEVIEEIAPLGVRGMGNRLRLQTRDARSVKQVIRASRGVRHSEKPEEACARLERLFGPDVRYLEMFRVGEPYSPRWSVFGNEAVTSVPMPTHDGAHYRMPPAEAKQRGR